MIPSQVVPWLDAPSLEWIPQITLVFFLSVRSFTQGFTRRTPLASLIAAYSILLTVGILSEGIRREPGFWLVLTGVHFACIWQTFLQADNHRYFEGYWCLTIGIALHIGGDRGAACLAAIAATLLGTCFAIALAVKIANVRFRDGSFFVHTMLFDERFGPLASLFGGVTPELRRHHLSQRQNLLALRTTTETLETSPKLLRVAKLLTIWTIVVEGALVLAFFLPLPHADFIRLTLLALFCITTFALVPVMGFGRVLLLTFLATVSDSALRFYTLVLAVMLPLLPHIPMAIHQLSVGFRRASVKMS